MRETVTVPRQLAEPLARWAPKRLLLATIAQPPAMGRAWLISILT